MDRNNLANGLVDLFGDHIVNMGALPDNCALGIEAFMRQLTGPTTVAWNVTQACNLQCLHCFNNSGKNETYELSHGEAMQLIDQFIEMKVFNVCVCGGEPLLRADLMDIINRLSEAGILVSMVSNGLLLDNDKARRLAAGGVRFLQISLDGLKAETHERLRIKPGSFQKAVNAARHVVDAGIELALAFCPTKFNIHEFPEYVDMVYGLGAKMIRMMPLLRLGRAIKNRESLIPTSDQMLEFTWAVREKVYEYSNKNLIIEWGDPLEHLYLFPYNDAKLFILELHSNGDIGISAYLPLLFGNIREHSLRELWEAGLKDAWRHPLVKKYAKDLVDLEDLQKQEPIPWEEREIRIDLFRNKWSEHGNGK